MNTRHSLTSLTANAIVSTLLCAVIFSGDVAVYAGTQIAALSPKITDIARKAPLATIPPAVALRPYKKLTGAHVFRGGPAAITDGIGSILSGLGYLGNTSRLMWPSLQGAPAGMPVTAGLGSILAGLGYGAADGMEMDWRDAYPVTRTMGVMLSGLGYHPGKGSSRSTVRAADANPPITRSMAGILKGLGYGRQGTASAAQGSFRQARALR